MARIEASAPVLAAGRSLAIGGILSLPLVTAKMHPDMSVLHLDAHLICAITPRRPALTCLCHAPCYGFVRDDRARRHPQPL